jgi:hypothetical protein
MTTHYCSVVQGSTISRILCTHAAACPLHTMSCKPSCVYGLPHTGGKRVLVEHMQGGKAWGLKTKHASILHGSTDFPRWATAEAPFRIHKPHQRQARRRLLLCSQQSSDPLALMCKCGFVSRPALQGRSHSTK